MATVKSRSLPWMLWRYVTAETLPKLLLCLAGFIMVFLLLRVTDDLADFNLAIISLWKVILYFLATVPGDLVNVIPMSMLLATSWMTVKLGKNNEMTAMRSSGLSLAVCATPVWILALVLCLLSFGISEFLATPCASFCEELKRQGDNRESKRKKEAIACLDQVTNRDWYLIDLDSEGKGTGVVIRQYDGQGRTSWVISAREAVYRPGEWQFLKGEEKIYSYDSDGFPQIAEVKAFDQLERDFPEEPQHILDSSKSFETLRLAALLRMLHQGGLDPDTVRLLKTMVWNRLTFPLASLVGALFGFSLSLATGRGGVMKGFASAVGLLVVFVVFGQATMILGKAGMLSPFLAGGVGNLLFTAGGIWLVWKRR